jgi:hypothetical protein
MAVSRKTEDVLASARKDLGAQLADVRDEIARLTVEEHALTQALSSLDGANPSISGSGKVKVPAKARTGRQTASRTRKPAPRRRGGATKSTAERLDELQGILMDGPKSRADLAAALKVSPPRIQQLLSELGSSVTSEPDPDHSRGKLWGLKPTGNGHSSGKPAGKSRARGAKRAKK